VNIAFTGVFLDFKLAKLLRYCMDIREAAKASYDRALGFKNLKERMLGRLTFTHEGGLWVADEKLICLLGTFKLRIIDEVVILDSNSIPRRVSPIKMLEVAIARNQEVLNEWHVAYEELKKVRE
jgi:hypothetical protein